MKALLAKGADPNGRITTSAMFMGYIGYPKKGAFEPFATGTGDLRGATPLWVAAYATNGGAFGFGAMAAWHDGRASGEVIKALLAAGANPHLTTADGTTPLMVAAGMGRATFQPGLQRGRRSPDAPKKRSTILLDAGADINAVNEADFTALHGAAFRGLNEVIQILVDRGADINARDFRGRTAVPHRGRLQAVVPVPGVSGDRRVHQDARRQHAPRRRRHRAGTRARLERRSRRPAPGGRP